MRHQTVAIQRQLADQYQSNAVAARDDRAMFREELQTQREKLRAAAGEMRRAIDRLDDAHRMLRQDVREMKTIIPAPVAPEPKPKDGPGE